MYEMAQIYGGWKALENMGSYFFYPKATHHYMSKFGQITSIASGLAGTVMALAPIIMPNVVNDPSISQVMDYSYMLGIGICLLDEVKDAVRLIRIKMIPEEKRGAKIDFTAATSYLIAKSTVGVFGLAQILTNN